MRLPAGLAVGWCLCRRQRTVGGPAGWKVTHHEGAVKRAGPWGEERRIVEKAGADFGSHGLRGPAGEKPATIIGWQIDRENYTATAIMSDNSDVKPLQLRSLFEQFHDEAG